MADEELQEMELFMAEQEAAEMEPDEEAVEETTSPQEAPEVEKSQEAEETEEKHVPLAALHEERMKRKELAKTVKQMEARFQQMMESLRPKEPDPEIPDFQQSPAENLSARMEALERARREQIEAQSRTQQEMAHQKQYHDMISQYQADAQAFQKTNPDFQPAYNYWQENRLAELEAAGFPREQAIQVREREEAAIVWQAFQNEQSPAAAIMAVSKARGFKPPQAKPDIETIAKGQKSPNLNAGGSAPPQGDSLEALAAMDDDEFVKNWDRIVGGN